MKCPECQTDISDDSRFCSKCGMPVRDGERAVFAPTRTILKAPEELAPDTVVAGKYRIHRVLGRGGMGVVYKAEDTKLQRPVALKFLPPDLVLGPEARDRFVVEARAAAALSHPNICTIYEIHDEGDRPFIAMELVHGLSLKAKIAQGALRPDEAAALAVQIADGLEEAHRKGIIHRDIKSANIMVTAKGQAKIMDFGLAKVKGGTVLTREGTTLGTVAYMSPEQALGRDLDHRTDIWSLGVVLYELLSGRLPFQGEREATILYNVVHEQPRPMAAPGADLPRELQRIVTHAMEKNAEDRYATAEELSRALQSYSDSLRDTAARRLSLRPLLRALLRPAVAIPVIVGVAVIAFVAVRSVRLQSKVRWARETVLPEAGTLIEGGMTRFPEAYGLLERAERYIPNDTRLAELYAKCSVTMTIKTTPDGARIFLKNYATPGAEWTDIGVSPLLDVRAPIEFALWKFEKEGFETSLAVLPTFGPAGTGRLSSFYPGQIERTLAKAGSLPAGMVRVPAVAMADGSVPGFLIDRCEVTNKQYKEFVDKGGYLDRKPWKETFIKDGREISWAEARLLFVDATGRPGPAGWQAGDYPPGESDHPVSGVSWYEAAAYAESVGKSLPTSLHWEIASGQRRRAPGLFPALLATQSNFRGAGPEPVGEGAMTEYGAMDMAGNVSEWCSNETPLGRVLRGGAWNDPSYMFASLSQAPAFDRSLKNGFRCVIYESEGGIPSAAFGPVKVYEPPDLSKLSLVPDPVFRVYKDQFSYDQKDLKATVEYRNEDGADWIHEKVGLEAAYGEERVTAHLFLPKKSAPPYQTVVYFPGSSVTSLPSSDDIEHYREFENHLAYLVKNGRAVLFPIYKGTFERGNEELAALYSGTLTHQYTDLIVQIVEDFKRSVDYLETRPEIDIHKLALLGFSWGGRQGPLIAAVDDRIKTLILLLGGMQGEGRPEASPVSYVRRIAVPTLMLNGRYDFIFPYETQVKPLFDMLGTRPEEKALKLYDSGHQIPPNEEIKEVLAWLDKWLGPVR